MQLLFRELFNELRAFDLFLRFISFSYKNSVKLLFKATPHPKVILSQLFCKDVVYSGYLLSEE